MSDEVWDTSNEITIEGMKMAKEVGAPVILHIESSFSPPSPQLCDKIFIWEKFLFLEFLTLIEVV